jgi:hypothetical protein
MGDVLRKTGANYVLLFPDDRTNTTLNSSSPGSDSIATTDFEGMLLENGEVVATNLAALEAGPFNLTIDNVSGAFGIYKVNLTLPNRSTYDLFLRHTSALITVRQEQFDMLTRDEIGSVSRENTRYDFTIAAANIPARNVQSGVLDKMRIRRRFDGAADFSAGNLVQDLIIEFTYPSLGSTNPSAVIPQ